MGPQAIDRLREFLAQLPPQSQALLMREFERAVESGQDVAVANLVLEQLRKVVRRDSDNERPRVADASRLVLEPLEPFLCETSHSAPGQVRRSSLLPIWQWLHREAIPDETRKLEAAIEADKDVDKAIRAFQLAASDVIAKAVSPTGGPESRSLGRIGAPSVVEDLMPVGAVLGAREALDTLGNRLPRTLRTFAESHVASTMDALNVPTLQSATILPFALAMVMQRLGSSWHIVRLAIKVAGSDDEIRVAGTPFGVAVSMAIHDLARVALTLRSDIKRGRFDDISSHLKTVHDGIRGLRTELDIRSDSAWGRQLASIRVEISSALQSEIESVPGRVRRLLRQRPDKDITAASKIDTMDVDETVALIDFVATCRNYASELAINEVTLRTYSELQHYVERSTEALVASLRTPDQRVRAFRKAQVDAAVRFCEILFGFDYASLMSKAADNAVYVERKAAPKAS
ncbi:MAG: hypothetical protein ACOY4O_12080 [Pseudomonadota bacterium]